MGQINLRLASFSRRIVSGDYVIVIFYVTWFDVKNVATGVKNGVLH